MAIEPQWREKCPMQRILPQTQRCSSYRSKHETFAYLATQQFRQRTDRRVADTDVPLQIRNDVRSSCGHRTARVNVVLNDGCDVVASIQCEWQIALAASYKALHIFYELYGVLLRIVLGFYVSFSTKKGKSMLRFLMLNRRFYYRCCYLLF